jgi:hypothetical protein
MASYLDWYLMSYGRGPKLERSYVMSVGGVVE